MGDRVVIETIEPTERFGATYLKVEASFAGLEAVARQLLDTYYPADITLLCHPDSPDCGPRFIWHLRRAFQQLELGNLERTR